MTTLLCGTLALALAAGSAGARQSMQPGGQQPSSIEHFIAQAPKGTLTVQVVQGSAGGSALAGSRVDVDLYHNDRSFRQLTAILDENGLAVIADIPVILGVIPVVHVKHAGVTYQEPGALMSPDTREMSIEVRVFDTTSLRPDWRISMRHVLVRSAASGLLNVSEMVVVESPGDRTWIGDSPDEQGRTCTVRLNLPADARRVQLTSGFHGWCCTKYAGSELSVWMPLMPGKSSFEFSYEVPFASASRTLNFAAQALTENLVIFVGEGAELASVDDGLVVVEAAGQHGRLVQGQGLIAGVRPGIVLTSLNSGSPPSQRGSSSMLWTLAAGSAGLLAAAGIWLRLRSGAATKGSVP
jgi:hypothetical protein